MHLGLAIACKGMNVPGAAELADEMKLNDDEAKQLADALADIQEEYGMIVSRKTQLWINLVTALGVVYVPRGRAAFAKIDEANKLKGQRRG